MLRTVIIFHSETMLRLLLLLLLLLPLSLLSGSVSLSPSEVCSALWGEGNETLRFIVWESRLPQTATALLAGMALSAVGLVLQTLFANPLADPSLLGIHSGASLGAAVSFLLFGGSFSLGVLTAGGLCLTVFSAFLGACGVILLLALCSRIVHGTLGLLIVGVMISFAVSALVSLLSFYAAADGLQQFIVWGFGSFANVGLEILPFFEGLILLALLLLLPFVPALDALLLGDDYARNLGIRVRRSRTLLLLLGGFLVAVTTSLCGPISFIGMAVPHLARLSLRSGSHRSLLPATLLWGGNIALLALMLSHLPGERGTFPLAAITPLFGVPAVLWVLLRKRRDI